MTTVALFARLEAKPGKDDALIAKALMAQAPDPLAAPPAIEQLDVLGAKLPV
jgi:hypothetical protein